MTDSPNKLTTWAKLLRPSASASSTGPEAKLLEELSGELSERFHVQPFLPNLAHKRYSTNLDNFMTKCF